MSTSPTIANSSAKRPLEDPSSPASNNEQPDAKRPALDSMVSEPHMESTTEQPAKAEEPAEEKTEVKEEEKAPAPAEEYISLQNGNEAGQTDTVLPDAPAQTSPSVPAALETQPIQSTSGANGRPVSQSQHQDESNWLHLRACISTSEAATIIGKGGENVTQIRRMSGAKCTVSDYARGAVERILTVSGQVDAVSKVRYSHAFFIERMLT